MDYFFVRINYLDISIALVNSFKEQNEFEPIERQNTCYRANACHKFQYLCCIC